MIAVVEDQVYDQIVHQELLKISYENTVSKLLLNYSLTPIYWQGIFVSKKYCYDPLDQLVNSETKFEILNKIQYYVIFHQFKDPT